MPWCPKCKNEYRQGIKMCADCRVELVDKEDLISQVVLCGGPSEDMYSLKEYLEYNKFKNVNVRLDEKKDVYELFVDEKDLSSAKTLARVFLEQQMLQKQQAQMVAQQQIFAAQAAASEAARAEKKAAEAAAISEANGYQGGFMFGVDFTGKSSQAPSQKNVSSAENAAEGTETAEQAEAQPTEEQQPADASAQPQSPQVARRSTNGRYVDSADRAEDNRSSAWTLMIVGGLGMVVMILGITGVLPFNVGNPYMFYGVMSAVFILFFVMGVVSFKNAKFFAEKAESENSLKDTLLQWCEENLTAEKVDGQLRAAGAADVAEEEMYFRRFEMIRYMMNHQFMNLDQAFLEKLIDDTVYDMVYGSEEE